MIEVDMLDDIRSFKTKFLGPFTKRQCICVALAAPVLALSLYLTLGIAEMSIDTAITVSCVPAGVIASAGWLTISNMPLEQYLVKLVYRTFLTPKVRKYKTKLPIRESIKAIKKTQEQEKISKMSKKEQKAYEKRKKNEANKTITYGKEKVYK